MAFFEQQPPRQGRERVPPPTAVAPCGAECEQRSGSQDLALMRCDATKLEGWAENCVQPPRRKP